MKIAIFIFTSIFTLSNSLWAETYVETITQLSARDALVISGDSIYASNYNTGRVYKIELDGSTSELVGTSTRGPAGMRFDDNNNLYIAMYNSGSIVKIDPQGNETIFASSVSTPIALDWDGSGNLYVSSYGGDNTVTKISPSGEKTALGKVSQLSQVSSLCLDSSGDIYISAYNNSNIYKMTPSGTVSLFASTSTTGINYIQYDATNNQFYAATAQNKLLKIDANGQSEDAINSAQSGVKDGPRDQALIERAIGLAVSDNGKYVYFASDNHVRRLVFADASVDQLRPYFNGEASVSVEQNSDLNYQIVYVDPNNETISIGVEDLPGWISFDGTDTLTGTPQAGDVANNIVVKTTATDGVDTVKQNVSITVTALASQPAPAPAPTPSQVETSSGGSTGFVYMLTMLLMLIYRKTS